MSAELCVGVGDDKERGGSRTNYLWWKEEDVCLIFASSSENCLASDGFGSA